VPLKKEKDKIAAILSLGEDITSVREMENVLDRTKRLAEVGTLALTVVHELRNPLSVIKTAVYNLKRKLRDPLSDTHCATIDKKITEADRIINNLLLYAKLENECSETFKIYDVLNECVETQVKRFKNPDINMNTDMDSVKDVYIEGDPLRLSEVFNNILANAYESFSGGKGIIGVKAAPNEGGNLKIIFEDNGIGINEDSKNKIFDPFFSTKSKGTGLGLSLCKQIISMHKGDIYAENKKEGGAVFTVILPLRK
jgi:signal transduction histidine kinase